MLLSLDTLTGKPPLVPRHSSGFHAAKALTYSLLRGPSRQTNCLPSGEMRGEATTAAPGMQQNAFCGQACRAQVRLRCWGGRPTTSAFLDDAGHPVDGACSGCEVVGGGPDVGPDASHCAAWWQALPRLQ